MSSATRPHQSGRLLAADEMALPAVCGQTGKQFVMVVRRQARGVLELIRAVPVEEAQWVSSLQKPHPDLRPRVQSRLPSRPAPSGGPSEGPSEDPAASFDALTMSATINISSAYDGCPYCRARGYFHCLNCALFSCLSTYNRKPHTDHSDIWCAGCRSWRCTSNEEGDDDSSIDLTAYTQRERPASRQNRSIAESTPQNRITRLDSVKGYLK